MTPLASIGVACRSRRENPWLDRLLASLERHEPGLPNVRVMVEEGVLLTKVEKMNRLLRACPTRYLCVMEDDTQVLHGNWLAPLVLSFGAQPGIALVGPAETRGELTQEEVAANLQPSILDMTNLPGFCVVVDREVGLEWDVRVQAISDLYISLLARSRGYRCAQCRASLVRHSKEPWAPDDKPPWGQGDRSRFGEGDAYYEERRHTEKRLREARVLLDLFGDLARRPLPQELLAVLEPGEARLECQPGCTRCRQLIPAGEEWVMSRVGPVCFRCRFGADAVGVLSVSEEASKALAEGDD